MNHITKLLFLIFVLSACLSCSGEKDNQDVAATPITEMVPKKPKENTKTKSKATRSQRTKDSYWNDLKAELKLDDDKLKALRKVNNKTNNKVRAVRSKKKDNYLEESKAIRIAEREEMNKILGEELFQKKIDFDKSWTAHNTKDFKGIR